MNNMLYYNIEGCWSIVDYGQQIYKGKFNLTTLAVSEEKAVNNIKFQLKRQNNLPYNAKIELNQLYIVSSIKQMF